MTKYAFFDLSQTILKGYFISPFCLFISEKYLPDKYPEVLKEYNVVNSSDPSQSIGYYKVIDIIYSRLSSLIKGQKTDTIRKYAIEFAQQHPHPVYNYVKPLFEYLQQNNFKIIIITGDFDFIIRDMIEKLPHPFELFPSEMEVIDNVYTGKIKLLHNDKYKAQTIERIEKANPSNLTIAFGDSKGDIPMLEAADLGFLIYPKLNALSEFKDYPEIILVENPDAPDCADEIIDKIQTFEIRESKPGQSK